MAHGGARAGAGRKAVSPENKRVQLGARVTPAVKEWLEAEAKRQGLSLGLIIEKLVETT